MKADANSDAENALRDELRKLAEALPFSPSDDRTTWYIRNSTGAAAAGAFRTDDGGMAKGSRGAKGTGGPRARRVAVVAASAVAAAATVVVVGRSSASNDPNTVTGTAADTCSPSATAARSGVIASHELSNGLLWEVRVSGAPPDVEMSQWVDGQRRLAWSSNEWSWPSVVEEGMLPWIASELPNGVGVYGAVPAATTAAEIHLDDGSTTIACPVSLPGYEGLAWVGSLVTGDQTVNNIVALDGLGRHLATIDVEATTSSGGLSANAELDTDIVEVPLAGAADPPARTTMDSPTLEDVITGTTPSGTWALRAAEASDVVTFQMFTPAYAGSIGITGNESQLLGEDNNWTIQSVDGRHVIWGLVTADVSTIRVALDNGSNIDIGTVDPGLSAFSGRAFAAALPVGEHVSGIQGLDGTQTAIVEGTDPAGTLSDVDSFAGDKAASLLVVPVD